MCFFIHSSFECLSVPNSVWSYVHRYVRRLSVHLFVFSFWSLSFCEESLCFCCCDFFVICYDMGVLQSLLFWCLLPFSLLFVVVVLFLFLNFLLLSGPDLTGKRVCLFLYLRAICPFLYINYKHASNPSTCPSVCLSVYWPSPHISFDSFIFKFGARHDQKKKLQKKLIIIEKCFLVKLGFEKISLNRKHFFFFGVGWKGV